jgi:hypothetical protein
MILGPLRPLGDRSVEYLVAVRPMSIREAAD